jgi:hypothetical protein
MTFDVLGWRVTLNPAPFWYREWRCTYDPKMRLPWTAHRLCTMLTAASKAELRKRVDAEIICQAAIPIRTPTPTLRTAHLPPGAVANRTPADTW